MFVIGDNLLEYAGTLCPGTYTLSVSLNGQINYLDVNNPNKPLRVLYGHQKFITALGYDKVSVLGAVRTLLLSARLFLSPVCLVLHVHHMPFSAEKKIARPHH